jgi:alanine racemase
MTGHDRVWEEIDLDAIYQNVEAMQSAVTDVDGTVPKLCAVVKADGYGHGAVPIAKKIAGLVWGYAVATVDEALQLRQAQITKPILVLGFVDSEDYGLCIRHQIRVTLYERAEADDMVQEVLKYRQETGDERARLLVHIKLDTGMGRLGFLTAADALQEQSALEIAQVCSLSELDAEGCFMHFSKADEADKTFSNLQHQRFMQMIERLQALGVTFEICHCDNSAGIIDLPGWHGDMVRMGIALYGLYPSDEVNKKRLVLTPAMSLKSRLVYVKTVPAGTPISYGGTYVTTRETRIGTVPVGYADGYPRSLSNKGRVLVCGKSVPIIGRVCMDQMMVDLTDVPEAEKLMEVTLIGQEGAECITVEEAAALAGTFNYEFICGISKRVPRVYLEGGKDL